MNHSVRFFHWTQNACTQIASTILHHECSACTTHSGTCTHCAVHIWLKRLTDQKCWTNPTNLPPNQFHTITFGAMSAWPMSHAVVPKLTESVCPTKIASECETRALKNHLYINNSSHSYFNGFGLRYAMPHKVALFVCVVKQMKFRNMLPSFFCSKFFQSASRAAPFSTRKCVVNRIWTWFYFFFLFFPRCTVDAVYLSWHRMWHPIPMHVRKRAPSNSV